MFTRLKLTAQRRDPVISRIVPFVSSGRKPAAQQLPGELKVQQYLTLRRGMLHRVTHRGSGETATSDPNGVPSTRLERNT